jgi:hypothetical protein
VPLLKYFIRRLASEKTTALFQCRKLPFLA